MAQVQTASPDVTCQASEREPLRLRIPPLLPQEPCDISSLGEVWPLVRKSVMEAVELGGGTHTEEDVIDLLIFRKAFLWANGGSAVLCEFEDYPRKRICRYWVAGGSLEDLLPMESKIERWARSLGAVRMEICGRAGWLKSLKGYQKRAVWMTKDLDDASGQPPTS